MFGVLSRWKMCARWKWLFRWDREEWECDRMESGGLRVWGRAVAWTYVWGRDNVVLVSGPVRRPSSAGVRTRFENP